jgi:ribosome maturation factor RimP
LKSFIKITEMMDHDKKPHNAFTDDAVARIRGLAETLCASEEMELVHLEFQRESEGRILRVYIDKPGGIGLNDCVHISRQLGDLLDVYLEEDYPVYRLEISSPGPERPISKASDFERFAGHWVKLKTRKPISGQKNFTGKILGISEGIVKLEQNDIVRDIPYGDILKARLVQSN